MKPDSQLPPVNLSELAALCSGTPAGCIIEIGVYRGGSAFSLQQAAHGRPLHLFDTFTGIPEKDDIDGFGVGAFGDTSVEAVRAALPDAIFHVGIFPSTLTDDIKDIAFLHIDCDQYGCCRDALELLWPRMVPGGIVAFDDYPFPGIKKAIHDRFPVERILFTPCRIPYLVKGALE